MLSPNFQVREFRCHDGSDLILIDEALVEMLQRIRDHFQQPVMISSAYRTVAYNRRIGGAEKSQHIYGKAADIRVGQVSPRDVARWVETALNPGGLGLYDYGAGDKTGFVHVDTRSGKSACWVQTKSSGGARTVASIVRDYLDVGRPVLRAGSQGENVTALKRQLIKAGLEPYNDVFDSATAAAVTAFQKAGGLQADGIVGAQTWSALEALE